MNMRKRASTKCPYPVRWNNSTACRTLRNLRSYLTAVKQWGNVNLTSMYYAFYLCSNLKTLPKTRPTRSPR
ncbi:MAG: hypothetical protein ACLRM8_03840 [Alistipes sp.]